MLPGSGNAPDEEVPFPPGAFPPARSPCRAHRRGIPLSGEDTLACVGNAGCSRARPVGSREPPEQGAEPGRSPPGAALGAGPAAEPGRCEPYANQGSTRRPISAAPAAAAANRKRRAAGRAAISAARRRRPRQCSGERRAGRSGTAGCGRRDRLCAALLRRRRRRRGAAACRPCRAGGSPAARRGPRPSRARRGPGCSSPWAGCTGCCGRATTRSGWAPGRRCTWRPCWSTSRPRSWSWRATRPATTRRRASSPGTCSSPSATTRSSTSCWAA